jgi:hypothetical protein
MRPILRPVAVALSIACLAASLATVSATGAFAQAKQAPMPKQAPMAAPAAPPALKQIALSDKQIQGVLDSGKEMDPLAAKLPQDPSAKPDPKVLAQLDTVAKKYGFAGFDEYNLVTDNISLVMGGFDPQTKKYVGPEAAIKAQIATIQADKKMPPKDKKAALADLNQALKSPSPPVENKGNIDLVTRYYDKLNEAMSQDN